MAEDKPRRTARKPKAHTAAAPPEGDIFTSLPGASAGISQPSATGGKTNLSGVKTMKRILLLDLSQRELQERAALRTRRDRLEAIKRTEDSSGGLSSEQEKELANITAALDSDKPIDEFFRTVLATLAQTSWKKLSESYQGKGGIAVLEYGLFISQQTGHVELSHGEQELAFVCGLLELDSITQPKQPNFVSKISVAQGEYRQNKALFDAAYKLFKDRFPVTLQSQIDQGLVDRDAIGCIEPGGPIQKRLVNHEKRLDKTMVPAGDDLVYAMSARNLAAVVRRLVADGVTANDPWISSRLENAYNMQTGVLDGRAPSAVEIMLPDLEEDVDIEIQKENLHAVQALYFAYQLEEMRLFQVVERIVDLFRSGLLVLGRSSVGDKLFNYYKKSAERITELERRDLYMRVFGAPGGNPGGEPNRDFNELWLRFVSAVSSFNRQLTVDNMLRRNVPMSVSQEQVRKAARDLGANMSRNGYGIAWFAASELQQTIVEFRDILQDTELRSQFGARDMWQVIDQVNVNYLGGARNTHRYRTQARAGAIIIRWIAENISKLSNVSGPVIELEQVINPVLRAAGGSARPTENPTDYDLINACDQWLAVGGVQDQSVEQYSQPIESPIMTSRPIDIPQAARDVLSNLGINMPAM